MGVILIFLQHFYFRYCPTINQSITVLYKKWEEKITHVKNVGHTSKFLFGIYWWTWKTTIYWKQCWNRSIKNGRILEFKMLFKKKKEKKKNTKRYHILHLWTKNLDDMIYSSWDRVWQTEIGNYGSFFPFTCLPSNPPLQKKRKEKEKMKQNCWQYHHFTLCIKNHNHMRYSSWDTEWDTQKIEKMKKPSGYVIILPLCKIMIIWYITT